MMSNGGWVVRIVMNGGAVRGNWDYNNVRLIPDGRKQTLAAGGSLNKPVGV